MKTSIDFKDRVYEILNNSPYSTETVLAFENTEPVGEVTLVETLNVDHSLDVVDNAFVNINIIIPKIKGFIDNRRFRYLVDLLLTVLENYKSYKGDFDQFKKTSSGSLETTEVSKDSEYFHIAVVFSDGPHTDLKRNAYAYYNLRLRCWIEK